MSFEQGIDLLSSSVIDHYIQNINIETAGQYYLTILWMPPLVSPVGKVFGVIVNSVLISNVTVTDSSYVDHLSEFIVDLSTGINTLDIVYYQPGPDNYGVYVGAVKLHQLIPLSLSSIMGPISYLTYPLLENATRLMNKIPGGRKVLPFLCFMVNIDELWLYMFHERSYGSRMDRFFSNMQQL